MAKKIKAISTAAILLGSTLFSPAVFAANEYGIVYSGGEDLGSGTPSNVKEDAELIDSLTPLIDINNKKVSVSGDNWTDGYVKLKDDGPCEKYHYLTITTEDGKDKVESFSNTYFTIANEGYSAKIDIKKISLEGFTENTDAGRFVNVGVKEGSSHLLFSGWTVYNDENCTIPIENADKQGINLSNEEADKDRRSFVEMSATLYRNGKKIKNNGIYFGIADIDSAQSFKILNAGNKLSSNNMYAKSLASLQGTPATLKNKFVSDGNYIYAQYSHTSPYINGADDANIYVPLNTQTLSDGLEFVFGFAHNAGSSVEFYANQLNVKYTSDENGEISGIESEKVILEDSPSGSETAPKAGYELTYWTADKDVLLSDGLTVIEEGKEITPEQVKEVVVLDDIVFTAHHEKAVAVPDTGSLSERDGPSAVMIQLSAAGLSSVAILAFCVAHLKHKKVDFRK